MQEDVPAHNDIPQRGNTPLHNILAEAIQYEAKKNVEAVFFKWENKSCFVIL